MHTHPGTAEPWFSAADDIGDERLMPALAVQVRDAPRGSLVLAGVGATQRIVTLIYYATGTNGKGQLQAQTVHLSPSDLTTTYSLYDADARAQSILLEDGTNNVAFTFDQNGNLASLDPPGATATAHSFSYDPRDELSVYAPPAVSGDMSTRSEYTTDGLVASELRPDGDTLNFSYDTARRLTQASHPVRTLNYTYDARGRLSTISSNDTQTLTYGYTTTGALVRSQKWTGPVGGSGGFTTTYTYDNNHRVATETASGVTTTYTYDGDGLIANLTVTNTAGTITSNNTLTFGHDPGGNKNGLVTGATVGTLSDSRTYNEFGELAS